MGHDKARLPVEGRALLERVVDQVRELVPRVIVAAAVDQELPTLPADVEVVRDDPKWAAGPLRGVQAGLAALPDETLALVWAGDCPTIPLALVEALFARAANCEAAVPRCDGFAQPLTAVYRVGPARRAIDELAVGGESAAHRLADRLDTAWLEGDELRALDPESALQQNLNTPEEYARFIDERQAADEVRLPREVLDWHERERRLIAYDIHDGLVQDVTGALLRVEALLASSPPDADRLQEIAGLLRGAIDEGRRLIAGLRPPILDESGLLPALRFLIEGEFRDAGLAVELAAPAELPRGSDLVETSAFRIVREALANVARHSGAARATVGVRQVGHELRIEIRDGGRGFDPASVGPLRFGLRGIRERARILGGQAEIAGQPGRGTTIRVWLPWDNGSRAAGEAEESSRP